MYLNLSRKFASIKKEFMKKNVYVNNKMNLTSNLFIKSRS